MADEARELVVSTYAAPAKDGTYRLYVVFNGLDDLEDAEEMAEWIGMMLGGDSETIN